MSYTYFYAFKIIFILHFLNFARSSPKKENLDYYMVTKKLTIDLGAKETFCVHQFIDVDYDVFVFGKVVGQANRLFGLEIVSMTGHVLYPYKWDDELSHKFKTSETGDYMFCLQNAQFQLTRVVLNINGMNPLKYMEQLNEISKREQLEDGIGKSFAQLMTNIVATAQFITYINQHSLKDSKLIEANYNYVNTWSFMQCCAIIFVGYAQLRIMKRLFTAPNVTPSGKPRA